MRPTFTFGIVDVDPVVGEDVLRADHQRDRQEVAIAKVDRIRRRLGQRVDSARELADRRRRDDVRGVDHHALAVSGLRRDAPAVELLVERNLLERMVHEDAVALGNDEVARRFPHHAGAFPRIAEGLEQGLGFHPVVGLLVEPERALQAVEHRAAEAKPLDPLRRPVRRNLVARHAPDLLGVGLEEDVEELLAELVDGPILERLHVLAREKPGLAIGEHAHRRAPQPQVAERLEPAQRIGIIFAVVKDAAHPRPLNEVVREDLVPEVDHLARLGEEAVPADVEAEAVVLDGAADLRRHRPDPSRSR